MDTISSEYGAGSHFLEIINPIAIAITAVSLIVLFLTKIHPILVILAASAVGGYIAFRRSILKPKVVL